MASKKDGLPPNICFLYTLRLPQQYHTVIIELPQVQKPLKAVFSHVPDSTTEKELSLTKLIPVSSLA